MKDDASIDKGAGGDEGFLSRWSRRKQQLDQAEQDQPVALDAAAVEPEAAPEPLLTDADMPSVDTLDEGSDYSGFLSPGVSEELRQLALRKLFRAASFNITDGLDDYDDDFTSFAKLGDIVTREMRVRNAIDEACEDTAETTVAEATPAQHSPSIAAQDDPDNTLEAHPEEVPHEQQSQPA